MSVVYVRGLCPWFMSVVYVHWGRDAGSGSGADRIFPALPAAIGGGMLFRQLSGG